MTTPTTALHGKDGSVRVVARVERVAPSGMPVVVIDIGEVKGIPLSEIHKIEEFLTRVYDWRRNSFIDRKEIE